MPLKVLVVATWGYPPSWKECAYRVKITHKGFRSFLRGAGVSEDLLNEFKLTSCCSTIAALTLLSKSKSLETHAIIFGSDSVINPGTVKDGYELREEVRRRYREWFNELVRTSVEEINGEARPAQGITEPEFVILPSVGNYYGWRFEGSVDHLFLKAYHAILRKLSSDEYNYVVIDLTHGINFQTISVLYALIAASLTLDKEGRLVLLNSEPALLSTKPCIKVEKTKPPSENLPQLSILDVTKLQSIIKLIRVLRNVTSLNPLKLGNIRRELSKENEEALKKIEHLVKFINILANGAVALTYLNAYCVDDAGKLHPLGRNLNPCTANTDTEKQDTEISEYVPTIVGSEATIRYDPANAYEALNTAITRILKEKICTQLLKNEATENLIEYLSNAKKLFETRGHTYLKLIINQAEEELKNTTKYVTKCVTGETNDKLCQEILKKEIKTTNNEVTLSSTALRKLYINKEIVTNILKGTKEETKEPRNPSPPTKKEGIDPTTLRNLCAHAGLEHDLIKHITIEINTQRKPTGKITKIMYTDCKTMKKVLQTLT